MHSLLQRLMLLKNSLTKPACTIAEIRVGILKLVTGFFWPIKVSVASANFPTSGTVWCYTVVDRDPKTHITG